MLNAGRYFYETGFMCWGAHFFSSQICQLLEQARDHFIRFTCEAASNNHQYFELSMKLHLNVK
jgi:hypothetical protein